MPDWGPLIVERLAPLRLPPTREAEIVEEVGQHLDDAYREHRATGAPPDEARRAALDDVDLGALVERLASLERRHAPSPVLGADRGRWFSGAGHDLRYALRALRKSPGFALAAILSLALGSGANAAIFQLLDAVRLRHLPVRAPEQLADIKIADRRGLIGSFSSRHPEFNYLLWERVRDRQQGFSAVYAWSSGLANLAPRGTVRYAEMLEASGELFPTLGVRASAGRVFGPADDRPGCPGMVVVSEAFRRREWPGDSLVIGKELSLDGVPFSVIGVAEPSFFGIEVGRRFEVAIPLCAERLLSQGRGSTSRAEQPDAWWLAISGRLKPGWTLERASAQLHDLSPTIFEESTPPTYTADHATVFRSYHLGAVDGSGGRSALRAEYQDTLWLLLALTTLVFLIAAANVANLLLARGTSRRHEIAARLAIGASRNRLVRQLLTESLLLAGLGIGLGVLVSGWLSRILVALASGGRTPLFLDLAPNGRLFWFTAAAITVTCAIFGVGPAIQATGVAPALAMRSSGKGMSGSGGRHRAQRILVAGQVALSLVLLVAALLFVRTFRNLVRAELGFRQDGILVSNVDLARLNLPPERRRSVIDRIVERIRGVPGVESVATNQAVPVTEDWSNDQVQVEREDGTKESTFVDFEFVSDRYFETMSIPLRAGRDFTNHDQPTSGRVAVVNQAFAERFFKGASPVGRRFAVEVGAGPSLVNYDIVGLVGNTKYRDLRSPLLPIVFVASRQEDPRQTTNVLARTAGTTVDLAGTIRRAIEEIGPEARIEQSWLRTRIQEGVRQERLMAALSTAFGLLAVVLAVIGLYGVVSYLVTGRTNELGIRIALGAARGRIIGLVLRETLIVVGAGLVIGVGLAAATSKAAASMLYGIEPRDLATFVIAIAALGIAAVSAALIPAWRAARVDPLAALRTE